jgi:hypothetical protein
MSENPLPPSNDAPNAEDAHVAEPARQTPAENLTEDQPLKPEKMETHANHLHKAPGKGLWHYLFEFLMLFLAVFCGFFAEYKLEHRIEKDREREFIMAAIKEMEADIYWIDLFQKDSVRYKYLDSLSMLLLSDERSQKSIKKMYTFMPSVDVGGQVLFKNTTLTQLKNAGNLRLISNRQVADSLIGLDASMNYNNSTLDQLKNMSFENKRLCTEIFDFKYYMKDQQWISTYSPDFAKGVTLQLLSPDVQKQHELGALLKIQSNLVHFYHYAISRHKNYTLSLIQLFKKEYDIEE